LPNSGGFVFLADLLTDGCPILARCLRKRGIPVSDLFLLSDGAAVYRCDNHRIFIAALAAEGRQFFKPYHNQK
jgi:hypothetical protein